MDRIDMANQYFTVKPDSCVMCDTMACETVGRDRTADLLCLAWTPGPRFFWPQYRQSCSDLFTLFISHWEDGGNKADPPSPRPRWKDGEPHGAG